MADLIPSPDGPGEIAYARFGLRTRPAPEGSAPTVDAATALAGPDVAKVANGTSRPPEIALRLVWTGEPEPAPPRLAWVITLRGTRPVPPRGLTRLPGQLSTAWPTQPVTSDCAIVVDAGTGDTLMSIHATRPV